MRERGRAIPTTPTVPIVTSKPIVPPATPRIVEGRVSIYLKERKTKNEFK